LPQSPQQQQEQPEPAAAAVAVAIPVEVETVAKTELPPPPSPSPTIAPRRPQLPAKPQPQPQPVVVVRRARPSVLLKPQYACFLQHDDAPPKTQPAAARPRKAASFTMGNQRQAKEQLQQLHHHHQPQINQHHQQQQQQQSKYDRNECTGGRGSGESPAPELQQRRRRPSLPSSLALSNASSALLQARIPGTTLYYV